MHWNICAKVWTWTRGFVFIYIWIFTSISSYIPMWIKCTHPFTGCNAFHAKSRRISMVLIKGTFFPSQFSILFGFQIHNNDKILALSKKPFQMGIICILGKELEGQSIFDERFQGNEEKKMFDLVFSSTLCSMNI